MLSKAQIFKILGQKHGESLNLELQKLETLTTALEILVDIRDVLEDLCTQVKLISFPPPKP